MKVLSQTEKDAFLGQHLRHRLTLLRSLGYRSKQGRIYQGEGDIYRCVKDSNLIAVRLLLDFLGLKGVLKNSVYSLEENARRPGAKYADDIKLDQFVGKLLLPTDVDPFDRTVLAGVYHRADKELAHLTSSFNEEYNDEARLIEAAEIVEELLRVHLYGKMGVVMPEIDA